VEDGMKRFLFVNALVAMVGAATIGVVGGGAAHAVVACTGNITGMTINGSVLAGPGCESFGHTTIKGSLTTQVGGGVFFDGPSNTVYGRVFLNRIGASSTICGTVVTGNFYISGNAHSVSVGPQACGSAVDIDGSLSVQSNTAAVLVKNTTVDSNAFVGSNGPGGAVTLNGNTIGVHTGNGVLSATNNTGGGSITSNTVGGNLTASNTPAYTVSGNTVGGTCNNQGTHTC
jgi:hypothetical protein